MHLEISTSLREQAARKAERICQPGPSEHRHSDTSPRQPQPPSKLPSKLLQLATLIGIIANLKKRKQAGLKAGNLLADKVWGSSADRTDPLNPIPPRWADIAVSCTRRPGPLRCAPKCAHTGIEGPAICTSLEAFQQGALPRSLLLYIYSHSRSFPNTDDRR